MMKFYELSYLYSRFSEAEEIEEFINKVKLMIEDEKGIFYQSSPPIKKKLAYEVDKNQFAYLGMIEFDLKPAKIKKFKNQLKAYQDLLRFVIFKKNKSLIRRRIVNVVKNEKESQKQEEKVMPSEKKFLDKTQNLVAVKKIKIDDISKKLDELLE